MLTDEQVVECRLDAERGLEDGHYILQELSQDIRALLSDRAELVAKVEKLREALRWALSTWSEMEATNDDPIPPHGCRFYRGECDCSFHNEFVDAWNLAGLPWSEEDEETPDDR